MSWMPKRQLLVLRHFLHLSHQCLQFLQARWASICAVCGDYGSLVVVGGGYAVGGFCFFWDVQWVVAVQWIGGCDLWLVGGSDGMVVVVSGEWWVYCCFCFCLGEERHREREKEMQIFNIKELKK